MKAENKGKKEKTKEHKKFIWIAGIINLINIILVALFFIYLYFWIRARS